MGCGERPSRWRADRGPRRLAERVGVQPRRIASRLGRLRPEAAAVGRENGESHWDIANRSILHGQQGWIESVAINRAGTDVVLGSLDGPLTRWNVATRRSFGDPLTGHEDAVATVEYSPDGTRVLSGGDDGTLRTWDANTGQAIGTPIRAIGDSVSGVMYSPDRARILSVSGGTLQLWDASRRVTIGSPIIAVPKGDYVVAARFAGTPTRIVSVGSDGSLKVWPTPNALAEILCQRLTRNLSHREWREYVLLDLPYAPQCQGLPIPP